jgi:outer membrane protein assembly factor BamB
MKFYGIRIHLLIAFSLAPILAPSLAHAQAHWPSWRGPDHSGAAREGNPPTQWSESKNIKWKVELPGHGKSTPIVWGDKMFLLTSSPVSASSLSAGGQASGRGGRVMTTGKPKGDYQFDVLCLNRLTGKTVWRETAATETPQEGHHPTGSFASYSAVTDGKFLWASFGSRGLHCFDLDGGHQWSAPLPKMSTRRSFGEGSSPVIAGDVIAVVQDHEGASRIGAYDKRTGKLRWEKSRDEASAWSSPYAVTVDGVTQIITNATNRIRSYNAANGDIIWECGGMTVNVIPTPVVGFGNAYCASGFRGAALTAIDLKSKGDVTDSPVWNIDRATPYVPSPLLYDERIYYVEGMNPRLSCANAKTGEVLFSREGLEGLGRVYASPVGAGGHVYIPDREGVVAVISHADSFKTVATNTLDDVFDASPVVVGNTLYLRGDKYLYCIEGA